MEQYSKFRPTGFDAAGLALDDRQDWMVLEVSKARGSGPRALSNFDATIKSLEDVDPNGNDHEEHSFGHWAYGYLDIIIVRPGSECEAVGEDIEAALADYPILDDEDVSRREWEEHRRWMEEHSLRVCHNNDYDLDYEQVDWGSVATAHHWYHNGRNPSDEDLIAYLVEQGWATLDD